MTVACLALAGCVAGPNFQRPAAPEVGDYTAHPVSATDAAPGVAGGDAQRFIKGADIPGDWWTLFHSRSLDDLIEQALANNHDLKAARAALLVARENALAQRGAYYPAVGAGFAASHQQQSTALAPTPNSNAFEYSLFTPQVSVSYSPDVFGLNRRTMESVKAQEQNVRFQMIAAYTTLTANVVVTAIQAASVSAQIDATRELVGINSAILSGNGGNIGIGFAIPVNMAKGVEDQLIKFGQVKRGILGVQLLPVTAEVAKEYG